MTTSQDSPGPTADQLVAALSALERALLTPLVPGELFGWFQSAHEAAGHVGPLLRKRIEIEHHQLLKDIIRQDADLASRIERMRQDNAKVLKRFSSLEHDIGRFTRLASTVDPREDRFEEHMQRIVQDGLDFIVKTRGQEAAVATWYHEASMRDRGAGG